MEHEMEALGRFEGVCRDITPIMENQTEKNMENEMGTGIIIGYAGVIYWENGKESGYYYIIMGCVLGLYYAYYCYYDSGDFAFVSSCLLACSVMIYCFFFDPPSLNLSLMLHDSPLCLVNNFTSHFSRFYDAPISADSEECHTRATSG